jgi:Zn finger protein HypA/HybF involved in hydrogenase expression
VSVQIGSFQDNWAWCRKCQGLFFNGNPTSRCPAGGAHSGSLSGAYRLLFVGSGQENWRWCQKCQGLFFFGSVNFGRCPAGTVHDPFNSSDYVLEHNAPFISFSSQPGWRWCRKCQGLFFAGNQTNGRCPAGAGHDPKDSGEYSLMIL